MWRKRRHGVAAGAKLAVTPTMLPWPAHLAIVLVELNFDWSGRAGLTDENNPFLDGRSESPSR